MSKVARSCFGAARGRRAAQPRVDVAGGLLAVADADRHGALARHHVAAGEHAGASGHQRRRHLHGAVALELDAGHRAQEGGVGLLAERQDHGVGGERLEPAGRLRVAGLVELHHLDLQLRAVEGRDRPQPVDPHALALGVLGLLLVGRHLLAGAPVDDQRLVRAQPAGDPGGVHRRVAAAVDRDAAADHRPLAGGDAAQERHRVHDRPGVAGRDVDPLGQVRADRDEDRVEAALLAARRRGPRPGARSVIRTPSAAIRSSSPVEHVAGQPVGRDAVAHHPAGLVARVADLDLVAEPGQVVGGRQPARPGADHEHPLAAADRRRVERPALLEREVAQEPLDRMDRDGAVEVGAVADALARVVADPPVDRRAAGCRRPARATPARGGPPACATSQAWMFSPAGQPALHGGSRST